MAELQHGNGQPLCVLYGAHNLNTPKSDESDSPADSSRAEGQGTRAAGDGARAPGQGRRAAADSPAAVNKQAAGPVLHCPGAVGQGPVVTFNVLQADGNFTGYR